MPSSTMPSELASVAIVAANIRMPSTSIYERSSRSNASWRCFTSTSWVLGSSLSGVQRDNSPVE
jgi:hypothetical protein